MTSTIPEGHHIVAAHSATPEMPDNAPTTLDPIALLILTINVILLVIVLPGSLMIWLKLDGFKQNSKATKDISTGTGTSSAFTENDKPATNKDSATQTNQCLPSKFHAKYRPRRRHVPKKIKAIEDLYSMVKVWAQQNNEIYNKILKGESSYKGNKAAKPYDSSEDMWPRSMPVEAVRCVDQENRREIDLTHVRYVPKNSHSYRQTHANIQSKHLTWPPKHDVQLGSPSELFTPSVQMIPESFNYENVNDEGVAETDTTVKSVHGHTEPIIPGRRTLSRSVSCDTGSRLYLTNDLEMDGMFSSQPLDMCDQELELLSMDLNIEVPPSPHVIQDVPRNFELDTQPETSGEAKWAKIMDLYKNVENLLTLDKFSWIAGCSVSSDEVEVLANFDEGVRDAAIAIEELKKHLPDDLHQYLTVTEEGPSMELLCTKFGSGCEIHELDENGQRTRSGTVTLFANSDETTYAFTVGHCVTKNNKCEIPGKESDKAYGKCIYSINNKVGEDLKNIKSKIQDIALLRMDRAIVHTNDRRYGDDVNDSKHIRVQMDKSAITVSMTDMRVLIHGPQAYCSEAVIRKVHTVTKEGRLVPNLLEMVAPDDINPLDIHTGHSGSLVTSVPDRDGIVRALSYLAGYKRSNHRVVYGLPLWEALSSVCKSVSSDEHNLLKSLQF